MWYALETIGKIFGNNRCYTVTDVLSVEKSNDVQLNMILDWLEYDLAE